MTTAALWLGFILCYLMSLMMIGAFGVSVGECKPAKSDCPFLAVFSFLFMLGAIFFAAVL